MLKLRRPRSIHHLQQHLNHELSGNSQSRLPTWKLQCWRTAWSMLAASAWFLNLLSLCLSSFCKSSALRFSKPKRTAMMAFQRVFQKKSYLITTIVSVTGDYLRNWDAWIISWGRLSDCIGSCCMTSSDTTIFMTSLPLKRKTQSLAKSLMKLPKLKKIKKRSPKLKTHLLTTNLWLKNQKTNLNKPQLKKWKRTTSHEP